MRSGCPISRARGSCIKQSRAASQPYSIGHQKENISGDNPRTPGVRQWKGSSRPYSIPGEPFRSWPWTDRSSDPLFLPCMPEGIHGHEWVSVSKTSAPTVPHYCSRWKVNINWVYNWCFCSPSLLKSMLSNWCTLRMRYTSAPAVPQSCSRRQNLLCKLDDCETAGVFVYFEESDV